MEPAKKPMTATEILERQRQHLKVLRSNEAKFIAEMERLRKEFEEHFLIPALDRLLKEKGLR